MSSPLFFESSSPVRSQPPSERRNRTPGSARLRSRLNEVSSPLRYSSSSQAGWNTSDPRTGGLLSDDRVSTHTPRRRRGDIHSSATLDSPSLRQVVYGTARSSDGLASVSGLGTSEADLGEPTRVIWGTNISIQDTMNTVRGFFMSFKTKYRMKYDDQIINQGQGEDLYYVDMLSKMHTLGLTNLNLDLNNFLAYPSTKKLFYQSQNYPQEIIPIIDQAIKETMHTIYEDRGASIEELEEIDQSFYRVRPYGLKSDRGMRELNPNDIDKLVSIKGIVIRTTPVIPDMKEAFFKCTKCGHTTTVELERGKISEPTQCPREVCKSNGTMEIVHNRCIFADKQVIKLQETPDLVPDGQTPHSVSLCVYDDLVDVCRAGDRIEVTGIFQSMPIRVNPRQRAVKSLFKTYLDVVHIQKADKKRLGPDLSTLGLESDFAAQQQDGAEEIRKISEEDVAKIKETAARPDVYDLLSRSIAPSIYELDDVKKGILLQLFGGANKTFDKGGSPRYRGDVNVLLCGDPSTSKSQLLQYVHKIAPRGVYTSGKSSSAVGLTAYVTRDPETRQYVLESGALVLSDGGICCIDEFDKMNDSTRAVLHEVMEQQTVSVAKAGIITSLNARTSILASANPIGSRYNPKLPVPQNIDLPPTLLSRFDLVYLMLDKVDEETDRKLARHIAGMYLEDRPENAATEEILPIEFLTMYISYAKQYVNPVISEPAKQALVNAYVKLRRMGEDARSAEKRVTATTRQLESMIRLSEALAKMKLSDTVTEEDVIEADRLIRYAIKDYATDPRTGQIDMDMVTTGLTAEERHNMETELRNAETENLEH